MKENKTRTSSILQRLPLILAVTAASYGLPLQTHAASRSANGAFGKDAGKTTQTAPAHADARRAARNS